MPVLGFGPDVEADPLGVLQALVDGHRAAGNLVEQGERGEIRRGRQDTGAVKVPLRNSSKRWENEVNDVKKAGQSRFGRGNGRGRAISQQTREDSQESSFRHGRGRAGGLPCRGSTSIDIFIAHLTTESGFKKTNKFLMTQDYVIELRNVT